MAGDISCDQSVTLEYPDRINDRAVLDGFLNKFAF